MMAGHALVCPQCGNLKSVCSNPEVDWHPQESYCYSTAAVQWKWHKLHEEFPKEARLATGEHPLDGLTVWASDLDIESLRLPAQQPEGQ